MYSYTKMTLYLGTRICWKAASLFVVKPYSLAYVSAAGSVFLMPGTLDQLNVKVQRKPYSVTRVNCFSWYELLPL